MFNIRQHGFHVSSNNDSTSLETLHSTISLHSPSALAARQSAPETAARTAPSTSWLAGTWYVTHSTLPMWKSKRDVRITYTPLPPSPSYQPLTADENGNMDRLDDVVSYRSVNSPPPSSPSTVHGVDEATGEGAWEWHGSGWLALFGPLARSRWEILGWGSVPAAASSDVAMPPAAEDVWVVTYFAKTLFTPAGIDIYSRSSEGLSDSTLGNIKGALTQIDSAEFRALAAKMFQIAR